LRAGQEKLKASQKRQQRGAWIATSIIVVCILIGCAIILGRLYGIKKSTDDGRDASDRLRHLIVENGVSHEKALEILATESGLKRDQVDAKFNEFKAAANAGKTRNPLDPARVAFADRRYNDSAQLADHIAHEVADAQQAGKPIGIEDKEL